MAKIERKTQKIFANDAGLQQITAFGTAKLDNPTFTTDVSIIQNENYLQGWDSSLENDLAPFKEDSAGLWYMITKQLSYIFQQGLPEWDNETEYVKGSWVKSESSIYESLVDNNINHQVTDINYWQKADFTYGGLPIGTVYPSLATSSFAPYGSVLCDGAEYSGNTYKELFDGFLVTKKLATCTYNEYTQSLSTYGNCAKFAVDTVNRKFRVPMISNGTFIEQGLNNASYNAALPGHRHYLCPEGTWENRVQQGPDNGVQYGINNGVSSYQPLRDRIGGSVAPDNIYGKSTTVQPKAVELRFFVVISTNDLNKADMDWSEYMANLEGKANKDGSNLEYPYLKTTYVNGTAGYNIWSNGYCEQWGKGNASANITLTKSYKDKNFNVEVSPIGTDVGATALEINIVDAKTIRAYHRTTTIGVFWKTSGYLAIGQY